MTNHDELFISISHFNAIKNEKRLEEIRYDTIKKCIFQKFVLPALTFFVVVSGHSDAILNPSAFPQWFQLVLRFAKFRR